MQIIEIHPKEHLLRGLLQEHHLELTQLPRGSDTYFWWPFFLPITLMDLSETTPVLVSSGPLSPLAWSRLSREERGFTLSSIRRKVERFSPAEADGGPLLTDYLGFGVAGRTECS